MAGFDDPACYGDRWADVYDDHHAGEMRPVAIRYAWPTELDLMAGQAGLQLAERYADWTRRPFDATSGGPVSIYRRT